MKHTLELGTKKIDSLLFRLSVPATVGMLVMVLYNIVDTIFVGRSVGTLGIAGLAIVLPIQMLIGTIGQTIGIGGSSIISRNLGSKNYKKANKTFGNLVTLTIGLSLIFVVLGYIFSDEILYLFGAKAEILEYANDYFIILLAGTPFLSFAMMGNNVIRSEGNAKFPMYVMIISAIINIILDPIFIFTLDMGIKGAALATVFSQIIAFLYLVHFFAKGKSVLKIKLEDYYLSKIIVKETFAIGASSFARQGAQSILAIILNHSLYVYGGEISVAAYGVLDRILRVVIFPVIGLAQGALVIIGFNYGALDFDRVKETLKKSIIWATVITTLGFIFVMLFSVPIVEVFSTDTKLISASSRALKLVFIMMPIVGMQIIGGGYFQAVGKVIPAFILTLSRQLLFLIPLVLIMPLFLGVDGIWLSFAVADLLSAIVTIGLLIPEIRNLINKNE